MADALHEGHRQRLKKRFLGEGLNHFQPHEDLEFLLYFGIQRRDTNELAHRLLRQFGSLAEVFEAPYSELCKVEGMTENAAILLSLMPSLLRVYLLSKHTPSPVLDNTVTLGKYLVDFFVGETTEVVYLLCLDSSLNAICCEQVARGTVTNTNVPLRTIVEHALRHNASRLVVAHNHPRGMAVPSNEDIIVTRYLYTGLKPLNMELTDHVVVSGQDFSSIRDYYPDIFE